MSERCFTCAYCTLNGDTYYSKWGCKKHGECSDNCYCNDYKKKGIINRIFG